MIRFPGAHRDGKTPHPRCLALRFLPRHPGIHDPPGRVHPFDPELPPRDRFPKEADDLKDLSRLDGHGLGPDLAGEFLLEARGRPPRGGTARFGRFWGLPPGVFRGPAGRQKEAHGERKEQGTNPEFSFGFHGLLS